MKTPKPPEKLWTPNALATLTKQCRRTVAKRLAKVTPTRQGANGAHHYTLEAALPHLVTPERLGETHRARKERLQADLLEVEHNLASEAAWPAAMVIDIWAFTSATILSALESATAIPPEMRDKLRLDIHDRLVGRNSPICAPTFFQKGKR